MNRQLYAREDNLGCFRADATKKRVVQIQQVSKGCQSISKQLKKMVLNRLEVKTLTLGLLPHRREAKC